MCNFIFSTPLHKAILAQNEPVFSLLLESQIDLELQNSQGQTVLAQALETANSEKEEETVGDIFTPGSFAARLVAHGSSPNAVNAQTGGCIFVFCYFHIIVISTALN